MGGCVSAPYALNQQRKTLLKERQTELLSLLYEDLAARSVDGYLSKENFSTFFHLSGLWSEAVFSRFAKNRKDQLTLQDFRNGICSYDSQIEILFHFYARENEGISYKQLLKMLYSYPKEELKNMIKDDGFITGLDIQERKYYLGNSGDLDEGRVVVEEAEESQEEDDPVDSGSVLQDSTNRPRNSNKMTTLNDLDMGCAFKQLKPIARMRKSQSIKHIPMFSQKPRIRLANSISLVVKKFAAFLFKQFGVDRDKGQLSYQQFKTLIQNHTQIFTQYFEGFHIYAWETNEQNQPTFKQLTSWYESEAEEIDIKNGTVENRYINFIKTTLFVSKSKKSKMPIEIKNMQGLEVHPYTEGNKLGFLVKHRDGIYPQKAYCFTNQAIKDQWLRHLKQYCGNEAIKDKYRMEEKIGAGNFSVVYRASEKDTQKEVAVKVIQKFRLTACEREVLKNECSILELCHHPRIANFMRKIQTKTNIYLITELMKSGDLADYIRKKTFLEQYEASLIVRQLIEAIKYLSSMGIIHRDLKAQNVMIQYNPQRDDVNGVKIIDFGFAIFKDTLKTLKGKEKYVGTPNYAAPQILLQEEYDQRVDIFSIGVIMYYMLAGKLPFQSLFNEQIYQATIDCAFDMDGIHWMNISSAAKQLLSRLLTLQSKRISLDEALKHPWVRNSQDLRAFAGKNRKKKYF